MNNTDNIIANNNNSFCNETAGEFALLRRVPAVLRARGFRLYTQNGQRLVDLWQNGGAAVLGHTPPSLLRELKNAASRGLYAPFPHFAEGRFVKALSQLFPGRIFKLYAAAPPPLEALVREGTAALWYPFANSEKPLDAPPDSPQILVPVLPGIQNWRGNLPLGLCVLACVPGSESKVSPGDLLSPVLLAAAARGVYDLIAAAPERANPVFPRIQKALQKNQWRRQGVYLFPPQKIAAEAWAAQFNRFLAAGFLLPPNPAQPVILPGVLSPGEEAKLAALFAGELPPA